ncbi:MAG: 4-hydroxy-tetrahydrodipicolinate reductase [Eubacteriales bacterium SKADARSKE-1]|nr:4-hydroxy-tetrahydrodipicolinate reductase [Eubacteriales bacterium SKADARSKE-1]
MTKVILSGACGKMGQVLNKLILQKESLKVVAGIGSKNICEVEYEIFKDPLSINEDADIIIDFSHPERLDSLLKFSINKKLPIVICTTGFSCEQIEKIKRASKIVPIFYSGNMSLGVNLLIELAKKAAKVLGSNFDIEIVEKHHNQKIDAPSGTALMLANAISDSLKSCPKYVYDRHLKKEKRSSNEIGIHSVRGGTIVGEHDVIFAGNNETVTLSHSAQSKEIFAAGALNAALFLLSKAPGLYNMSDLLG